MGDISAAEGKCTVPNAKLRLVFENDRDLSAPVVLESHQPSTIAKSGQSGALMDEPPPGKIFYTCSPTILFVRNPYGLNTFSKFVIIVFHFF
jgi:hypothetical protein